MKVPILALQQLYASVPPLQSPHGRGGFQTFLQTQPELTDEEVAEAESRLVYHSSELPRTKHVVFVSRSGRVVVALIQPLSEPDYSGRQGNYLAHCLWFNSIDLVEAKVDPFAILDVFPAFATLADAVVAGDTRSGHIPGITIEPHYDPKYEKGISAASAWKVDQLRRLVRLVTNADSLTRERRIVTVIGEPDQVLAAIRAAWLALPMTCWYGCSFDTYFHQCNLTNTPFWAVGLLDNSSDPFLIVVNTKWHSVNIELFDRIGLYERMKNITYARWVDDRLQGGHLARVAETRDQAYALAELLDGRPYDRDAAASAELTLVVELCGLARDRLDAILLYSLRSFLPPSLAERVLRRLLPTEIYDGLESFSRVRVITEDQAAVVTQIHAALTVGLQPERVCDLLFESFFVQGFSSKPTRPERDAIYALLSVATGHRLGLVWACWTEQFGWLQDSLAQLEEPRFREFVRLAFQADLVEPAMLVVPGRGRIVVDEWLKRSPRGRSNLPARSTFVGYCSRVR